LVSAENLDCKHFLSACFWICFISWISLSHSGLRWSLVPSLSQFLSTER
jgi:hypothetical protein